MKLPAEIKPAAVTVLCDTREQHPWDLSPLQMAPGTLSTGDYSLAGFAIDVHGHKY